jgi:hypothetical protein
MDAVLAVLLSDLEDASSAVPDKSILATNKQVASRTKEKPPGRTALLPVTNSEALSAPFKSDPSLAVQVGVSAMRKLDNEMHPLNLKVLSTTCS